MLFRHRVALRVAWTPATGTASRDPTPPHRGSRGRGGEHTGNRSERDGGVEQRGRRPGKRKGWQLCPTGNCRVAAKRSARPDSPFRATWNASFRQKIMGFKKRHAPRCSPIYRGFRPFAAPGAVRRLRADYWLFKFFAQLMRVIEFLLSRIDFTYISILLSFFLHLLKIVFKISREKLIYRINETVINNFS